MCPAKLKAIFNILDDEDGDNQYHPEVKSTLLPDAAIAMQKTRLEAALKGPVEPLNDFTKQPCACLLFAQLCITPACAQRAP